MNFTGSVGIFDSGVGGLTVVSEVRKRIPGLDIIYFGDSARVPYGNKSPEVVLRYSREIAAFLVGKGISYLVVACNTSSAIALEELESSLPVPVMGMIGPGAAAAAKATLCGKVGLIGTRATVQSQAYEKFLARLAPKVQVFSQACPLFVPLVEEGWAEDTVSDQVTRRYLEPLLSQGIDTLILGCTHYPVLEPAIRRAAGEGVVLISSSGAAAEVLSKDLHPDDSSHAGTLKCFVTDAGTYFKEVAERILGEPLGPLELIEEERLVLP